MNRGRKPKADDERRAAWLHLRLTASERAELEEWAGRENIPVSELARQRLGLGGLILTGGNPGQAMAAR